MGPATTRSRAPPSGSGSTEPGIRPPGRGPVSAPTGNTSPARSARPPNGPMRLDEWSRGCRTTADVEPAAHREGRARAALPRAPNRSAAPACTSNAAVQRHVRPSTVTSNSRTRDGAHHVAVGASARDRSASPRAPRRRGCRPGVGEPMGVDVHRVRPPARRPCDPSGRGPGRSSACPAGRP